MKTTLFDATDYLKSEVAIEAFLNDAREFGDEGEVQDAEAEVARARIRWALPAPAATPAPHRRAG